MTDVLLNTAAAASSQGWDLKDLASVLSAATAIIALGVSYLATRRTLAVSKTNTEAAAWQKANELELASIQNRLDAFYGPFRQMSGVNRLMNRDLRTRQSDDKFILLEKLFDKAWLASRPAGEKTLLGEIAANAAKLREFIENQVGMVDEKILPYLSRVSAHYRILELAYAGQLGDDAGPYVARYVFPAQIDEVLSLEVARLERRRELLKAHPFSPPPPVEILDIPSQLDLPEWPNPPRAPRPGLNMSVT